MSGHPAHQVREIRVTVKNDRDQERVLSALVQDQRDAVLRAGMMLGADPGDRTRRWIVTGVHDPANPGGAS
jgi:hypothetical protein